MTAATLSADQVLDLFTEIAETGSAIPPVAVRHLAWHGHTVEELAAAWWEFRVAIRERAALLAGDRHWADMYARPDIASLDDAVQAKCAEIDDAYRLLVAGPKGGTR